MKRFFAMLLCALLAICQSGCISIAENGGVAGKEAPAMQASTPAPTSAPMLAIAAKPAFSQEERMKVAHIAFRVAFVLDTASYKIVPTIDYPGIIEQIDTWKRLDQELISVVRAAFAQACRQAEVKQGVCEVAAPGWKLVASLYHRFGEYATVLFKKNCTLQLTYDAMTNSMGAEIVLDDLRSLIATESGEATYGPKLTYAYLNTVYDDEGEEISFTQYELSESYFAALCDPIPGAHIKDGWYKDRDKGLRKHTGTDIRSPEGTPILSCTDGTVVNIGSNSGAGNYVVVLDDAGIEYQYYHMVRLTEFLQVGDRVSKGDLVGHVGSTGNSSANHLHLTMISPEFTYINPYPVLRDMRALQKKGGAS